MVVVPLWAAGADRIGADPILRISLAAALACSAALALPDPWLGAIAILGWAWCRAPAVPIVDATTVAHLGVDYGKVRAVGSLSYLILAGASGALRDLWRPAPVALAFGGSLLTLALTFALPAAERAPRGALGLSRLYRHPVLAPMIAVSVLHGASIGMYDNLFAVHVQHLALPSWVTGAGIALGVGVEVFVLAFGRPLLARVGPMWLLVAAVASSIPRFAITAATRDPAWIVAAQSLHGLGFGAYWLAATLLFAEHAPPDLRNSAQAMLPTAMFGAGPVAGLGLAAVLLRSAAPDRLFAVAAALSVLALGVLSATMMFGAMFGATSRSDVRDRSSPPRRS